MFSRAVDRLNIWLASPASVGLMALLVAVTLVVGYFMGYDSAWGNFLGAATGLASMIFFVLVLHSDVRGNAALQLKLDQLILNDARMDNAVVASEDLPEGELRSMKEQLVSQVKEAVQEANGEK